MGKEYTEGSQRPRPEGLHVDTGLERHDHLMNESRTVKGVETLHLYHSVFMSCAHLATAIPCSMTRLPQP